MQLSYLSEEAYDSLLNGIRDNMALYTQPVVSPSDYGLAGGFSSESSVSMSNVSLVPLMPDASDEDKAVNDLVNVKMMYNGWTNLKPWQACNKYLWTYYCHFDPKFRDYIIQRYGSDGFTEQQIKQYFFATEDKRALVRRNALSSLWWKGYLTYDEEKESSNPYWILETLHGITNIADFLDTYNASNPVRSRGVAKGISQAMEEAGIDKLNNGRLRALGRYLNRLSLISPLDFFDENEIAEIVKAKFIELLALSEADAAASN